MRMLRAVVTFLLVFSLVVIPSFAESNYDFESMSIDELLTLRSTIDAVLCEKGVTTILPAGLYVVGLDITPGKYVISACSRDNDSVFGYYTLWKSVEDRDEYYWLHDEADASRRNDTEEDDLPYPSISDYIDADESFYNAGQLRVILSEGQVLEPNMSSDTLFSIEQATMLFG